MKVDGFRVRLFGFLFENMKGCLENSLIIADCRALRLFSMTACGRIVPWVPKERKKSVQGRRK